MKTTLPLLLFLSTLAYSQSNSSTCGITDALDPILRASDLTSRNALALKMIALEEEKLHLTVASASNITEAEAKVLAQWVLAHLQDRPVGRRIKHEDEDLRLLTNLFLSLKAKGTNQEIRK